MLISTSDILNRVFAQLPCDIDSKIAKTCREDILLTSEDVLMLKGLSNYSCRLRMTKNTRFKNLNVIQIKSYDHQLKIKSKFAKLMYQDWSDELYVIVTVENISQFDVSVKNNQRFGLVVAC